MAHAVSDFLAQAPKTFCHVQHCCTWKKTQWSAMVLIEVVCSIVLTNLRVPFARFQLALYRAPKEKVMFSHVMLGVNDLEVSKKFYDALLGTLGICLLYTSDAADDLLC